MFNVSLFGDYAFNIVLSHKLPSKSSLILIEINKWSGRVPEFKVADDA